ncbi:MAG: hypothetical protein U1E10_03830 [Bdellovibrionales bacterium]|nr:hypothetical protein [Bdellovibrionales bacterium]
MTTGLTKPSKRTLISIGADEREKEFHAYLARALTSGESQSEPETHLSKMSDLKAEDHASALVRLFGEAGREALTWLGSQGRASSETAVIGFADALLLDRNEPPRAVSVLPQAMLSALAKEKVKFDMNGAGLIVGVNDLTRSMAASLTRLGLKRVMLIDADDKASEKMATALSRRLIGIQFEALSRSRLTQIPSEASIAVNLTYAFDDSILEESILEDVSYLNFLRDGGVWIDWTGATIERGFSEEIANAGAMVFDPDHVRRWRDANLLALVTGRKAEECFDDLNRKEQP